MIFMELSVIDPNIFVIPAFDLFGMDIGPIALKWYGMMYLLGLSAAWWLGVRKAKRVDGWNNDMVADVVFYVFLGLVLGGRLGYVFFYQWSTFISDPMYLIRITEGGMSFHGGLLGAIAGYFYAAKVFKKNVFDIADFFAPFIPIGLGLGRVGNFINGELWGRVADPSLPWAMRFPTDPDYLLRHPSQLYQALTEGLLLFILLMWFSQKPRPRMAVSGLFLVLYGSFRIFTEFFRQPDAHLGLLSLNLSMGQLLSIPMIMVGGAFLYLAYKPTK